MGCSSALFIGICNADGVSVGICNAVASLPRPFVISSAVEKSALFIGICNADVVSVGICNAVASLLPINCALQMHILRIAKLQI